MVCEPLSALVPLQPPEAVHAVASLLDQLNTEEAPAFTLLGAALSVTIGALPETVTVADCVADPPAPVQVTSYSVVLVRAGVCQIALVGTLPRQLPTMATQSVAPVDVHVRVDLPPLLTVVGAALKLTVGAGGAAAAAGSATDTATD